MDRVRRASFRVMVLTSFVLVLAAPFRWHL
jgi:hypothetical protein